MKEVAFCSTSFNFFYKMNDSILFKKKKKTLNEKGTILNRIHFTTKEKCLFFFLISTFYKLTTFFTLREMLVLK